MNDTPSVPAHGTEPEERATGAARARVPSGEGVPALGWVLVALIAIVVLVYALGLF